jgi:hypothetical protein
MEARKPVTRRTYVVDRPFQLKYTLLLVLTGVLVSLLFGTMMFLVHQEAQQVLAATAAANDTLKLTLEQSDRTLIWLIAGATLLMGAALGLMGILITHRVAGPLYVMGLYMNQLTQGRYPPVRALRKNDELKVFFERFQKVLEQMRQKELDEAEKLDQVIQELGPGGTGGVEALKALRDLKRASTVAPPRAARPS